MAKGKNANPADAYRKAQRKKELKKNKTERAKTRDFALVKKDTHDLEDDIARLESDPNADKTRLAELKTELEKINKKKEEYVAEHPEHRKLVYRARRQPGDKDKDKELEPPPPPKRNLFNKHGLPRHPERSIYYDPVMNPYGVAPPGMPYMERPLKPDEIDSDQEEDSDDDIAMPAGPPPTGNHELEVDSDDDIPMPAGPPPGQTLEASLPLSLASPSAVPIPPLPPTPLPPAPLPPLPQAGLPGMPLLPNIPSHPTAPNMMFIPPPPPPGFPSHFPTPPSAGFIPPPPPGFSQALPPPPPGFFPRRTQAFGSMQDPLSSIPHQTFQAHRAAKTLEPHPSLPPKPAAPISAEAVISAEPELRDFKKEATSFVPSTLKRKKAGAGPQAKVNAAPSVESSSEAVVEEAPRPDLLGTLRSQLATSAGFTAAEGPEHPTKKPKLDDYNKFLQEMGDILGEPPS